MNLSERLGRGLALRPTKSKYGNLPSVVNGEKYRSKKEAKRHGELLLLLRAGAIANLRREVPFALVPGVRFVGSNRATPALRYVADFVYLEQGEEVVEDCKGFRTPVYKIKRHLMLALLKKDIFET